MSYKVYNPYPHLGEQFKEGMDYMIANLPSPLSEVTFEQLNKTLSNYFQTVWDDDDSENQEEEPLPPIIDNLVLSILPNAANSYQNDNLRSDSYYNEKQIMLITSIFDSIKGNDVEGIISVLNDANEEIAQSGMSAIDQAPLFVAVEIGKHAYNYWMEAIYDAESPWNDLLNANTALNVANIPFWVCASMEATLSGFEQIQQLDMGFADTLNSVGRSIGSTAGMLSAVGLSTGKMLFKWVKRLKVNKLSLNKEIVVNFGDNDLQEIKPSKICISSKPGNGICACLTSALQVCPTLRPER